MSLVNTGQIEDCKHLWFEKQQPLLTFGRLLGLKEGEHHDTATQT